MKRRIDSGYANCLIYARYMHEVHGWKMVYQRTRHNKFNWLVWFHVSAKPPLCKLTGLPCKSEQAFEPLPEDYKDVYFPKPLFKGRIKTEDFLSNRRCTMGRNERATLREVLKLIAEHWPNVWSNIAAFGLYVSTVYPDLSQGTVMASWHDGTLIIKFLALMGTYGLYNHGKRTGKITYVLPPGE
jgi:hypothetical protein